MSKITDIYMNLDGEQVHLSMSQFREMRETQPELKKLRFIRIDNSMYQATEKQFLEWEQENGRRKYLKKQQADFNTVSLYNLDTDDGDAFELLRDESVDVENEVITSFLHEALLKAFSQLTEDEKTLITALIIDGMSEREYSRIRGIPQKTISNRKIKALSKLRNLLKSQK